MNELERVRVNPDNSVRQVMECIDHSARGIALVLDEQRRLIGTVTDGRHSPRDTCGNGP